MNTRLDYPKAAPDAFQAVLKLETYATSQAGLDPHLIHLLKLRASQINGCAYCVDMHVKEARKDGLSEQWIALVSVWREALVFSPRERALLAWVEALTRLSEGPVEDAVFNEMLNHFTEADITKYTVAIGTINIWNRLSVGFNIPHAIDIAA